MVRLISCEDDDLATYLETRGRTACEKLGWVLVRVRSENKTLWIDYRNSITDSRVFTCQLSLAEAHS